MIQVHTSKALVISAPHDGLNTTNYTFSIGVTGQAIKTPAQLVNGMIAFPHIGFPTPGTKEFSITATGPGGSKVVTETVEFVTPPPTPPSDFGGPLTVVIG